MAQLMPLPLTVSRFSKIQIGFTFLVPAHQGSPGKGSLNGCVCVRACVRLQHSELVHASYQTLLDNIAAAAASSSSAAAAADKQQQQPAPASLLSPL